MTGIFYIDSTIFANATRVYTEAGLSVVAPDGFYVFGGVYRQQVDGNLLPGTAVCPECEATTTTSTTTTSTTTSTTSTTTLPPSSSTTTTNSYIYYNAGYISNGINPVCNNVGPFNIPLIVDPNACVNGGITLATGTYADYGINNGATIYINLKNGNVIQVNVYGSSQMSFGCTSCTITSSTTSSSTTTTQPTVYSAYFTTGPDGYSACNSQTGVTLYWTGNQIPNSTQVFTDAGLTQPYYNLTQAAYQGNVYSISNGYIFTNGICSDYTTTSTTTTSTTTTTTTTLPPAGCIEVGVYPPLVQGTTHTVTYTVCPGGTQNTVEVPYGGNMITICTSAEGIIADNKEAVVAQTYPTGNICSGDTTTTTTTNTTTTTTEAPPTGCYNFTATVVASDIAHSDNGSVKYSILDCYGNIDVVFLTEAGTWPSAFCGQVVTAVSYVEGGIERNALSSAVSAGSCTLM